MRRVRFGQGTGDRICGPLRGTPLIDSLLSRVWWQRGLLRAYLAYRRVSIRTVRELRHGPGSLPAAPWEAPSGVLYPIWGADHYFRVPELSRLLYRLFLYLGQTGHLAPACEVSVRVRQ